MSQSKLAKIVGVVAFVLVGFVAFFYGAKKELKVTSQLMRSRDTAPQLVELHKQALNGTARMLGPETLEMSLISAGFPPKRPLPSLKPRAELKGGGVGDAGGQTVAFSLYGSSEGRFTIFTLPAKDPEIFPEDTAIVRRRGKEMKAVQRGEVTLTFWKSGFWYTAVATEMGAQDRDLLIDLIRAAQDT